MACRNAKATLTASPARSCTPKTQFSVVAMVVRPGQQTAVHDHLAWCVVTVVQGAEQETTFRDHGDYLTPDAHSINPTGSVTALAPPGDIHRIRNETDTTAISLHVYGTDLRVAGSSVRRTYDLPIHEPAVPATRIGRIGAALSAFQRRNFVPERRLCPTAEVTYTDRAFQHLPRRIR